MKKFEKSALVRLTEPERKQLHQKAEKAKLSLSRYLVKSGLSDGQVLTAEEKEEFRQLRFELRKIGTNLNQIAFAFNASIRGNGEAPTAEELKETTKKVNEILEMLLQLIKTL